MLKVIAFSCDDGNCPTFLEDTETGDVYVQGYRPRGWVRRLASLFGSETRVRIPRAAWDRLQSELPPL